MNLAYSAMCTEIHRICKETTKFQDFIRSSKILITKNHVTRGSEKSLEKGFVETF